MSVRAGVLGSACVSFARYCLAQRVFGLHIVGLASSFTRAGSGRVHFRVNFSACLSRGEPSRGVSVILLSRLSFPLNLFFCHSSNMVRTDLPLASLCRAFLELTRRRDRFELTQLCWRTMLRWLFATPQVLSLCIICLW